MVPDEGDGVDLSGIEYDASSGTYYIHHEWDNDDSIHTSIVLGVAAVTDEPLTDMDPLYEVIDPEALDRLTGSLRGDNSGSVTFVYSSCEVTVAEGGKIALQPLE